MWTYYRQTYGNGDWSLFRAEAGRRAERFNRLTGWTPDVDNDLPILKLQGVIDEDDVISEQDALALIRPFPGAQAQTGGELRPLEEVQGRPAAAPREKPGAAQVVCPTCGAVQRPDAKFCHVDGTPIPQADEPARAEPAPVATVHPAEAALVSTRQTFIALGQKHLRRLIRRVQHAMGPEARANIAGVRFELGPDGIRLVATDGVRLALATLPVNTTASRQVTVPRATVLKLMEILADAYTSVEIVFGETTAAFRFPQGTLESRLIEGPYPDYRLVLPRSLGPAMRVGREALMRALAQAAPPDGAARVDWTLEPQKLTLASTVHSPESLAVAYAGPPRRAAFNARFLFDALDELDEPEVEIALAEGTAIASLTVPGRTDFQFVLMPIRT